MARRVLSASLSESAASDTTERLDVAVRLMAEGTLPFPQDSPAAEVQVLALRVQALRRERLIRLVAHAVAVELLHGGA